MGLTPDLIIFAHDDDVELVAEIIAETPTDISFEVRYSTGHLKGDPTVVAAAVSTKNIVSLEPKAPDFKWIWRKPRKP